MKSIEVSGKSVDEAIFRGLDELGLSIDEVDIEVISEGGKRLFGIGSKQCVIRLTERDQAAIEQALAEQAAQEAAEKAEKEKRREQRAAARAERPRENRPRRERERRPRGSMERHGEAPVQQDWGEPCEGGAEAAFLRGVLENMGMQATVDCFSDGQCLYMRISGPSMGVLIGRRGETLNALQYLTSLVANKQEGPYRRVVVDTEDYRLKREETLKRLAKRMAEDVRRSGKSISLEPMNPYERRVLHATLQEHPYVTTHSEGEEPNRHVVITLK